MSIACVLSVDVLFKRLLVIQYLSTEKNFIFFKIVKVFFIQGLSTVFTQAFSKAFSVFSLFKRPVSTHLPQGLLLNKLSIKPNLINIRT